MAINSPRPSSRRALIYRWGLCAVGFFALQSLTEGLEVLTGEALDNSSSQSRLRVVLPIAASVLWSFISSILALLFIVKTLRPRSRVGLRQAELIFIETLRSMAAIVIRLPLLALPAIYEWLRLTPVPFVVLFHQEYQRGEIDALKASRDFFRRHTVRTLLLAVLPLFSHLASALLATENHFLSISITAMIQLMTYGLLLRIYLVPSVGPIQELTEHRTSMSNDP